MADYYPLIARAVSGLDASATGEQRRALYERARAALIAQLRGVQPPLTESEITRERLTLEEAIRKVEQEAAQRARAAARGDSGRHRGDLLRGAQPSINPEAAPPPAERDRRSERAERTGPARDITRGAERESLFPSRTRNAPEPRPGRETRERAERPGVAQRRDRTRPSPDGAEGARGFRDVVADADELGGAAAEANRVARRTYANVPSPTPEFDRLEPTMEDRSAESELAAQMAKPAPRMQEPVAFPEGDAPDDGDRYQSHVAPARPDGRERPRAPLKTGSLLPIRRMAFVGLFLVLVGALIAYWPQLRGIYADMTGRAAQTELPKKDAASADRPKFTERVGQSSPVAPVAQRVVLYDEDPADPQGKQYVGQVVWRTENVSGPNGTTDIAIRADLDIPDRKFKATLTLRRNNDTSLPASHTVEMSFQLPPDFVGGGVANVPGVLMKSNEQTRGTPLAGLAVKVTDNFFLIGLSNVDADRSRNIQLLKERSWFDIPLVYVQKEESTGKQLRAIVALEKGAPGERVFTDAFAAWGQ